MNTTRFALPALSALVLLAGFVSTRAIARAETAAVQRVATPAVTKVAPPHAVAPSKPAFDPSHAFVDLGCVGCHGDDGVYRDEIKGALGKPVEQVARWIRNAPSIDPHTEMPSFQNAIDVPDSLVLAAFMQNRAAHL
jgi:mono/diheme cytochrome c family protein